MIFIEQKWGPHIEQKCANLAFSDGKFSSFKHVEIGSKTRLVGLPSVLNMIRKLNGPRNVRINTIGFAARENQVDASLKDIAKENGGTYEFIQTGEK